MDRLRQIIRLQMKFQHGTKDDDNDDDDDDDDGNDGGRRGIVRLLALFRFSGFFFCKISDLIIFRVVDFPNVLHILWTSGKFWHRQPQAEVRSTKVLHSFGTTTVFINTIIVYIVLYHIQI